MLLGLLDRVINIIYPPKCIFCQQLLNIDTILYICDDCHARLPFADLAIIPSLQEGYGNYCDGVISVFHYVGAVKESLIRFKFLNKPSYYKTYAALMSNRIVELMDTRRLDMILSVPLHKHKEFSRGYNQAYLISQALSRRLKIREGSSYLKRYRYTETQSLLDKTKRSQNVKGAFTVTRPKKVMGKSIILIDDILTTGSTLEECSRMLKQAGAKEVTAVVVATGRYIDGR